MPKRKAGPQGAPTPFDPMVTNTQDSARTTDADATTPPAWPVVRERIADRARDTADGSLALHLLYAETRTAPDLVTLDACVGIVDSLTRRMAESVTGLQRLATDTTADRTAALIADHVRETGELLLGLAARLDAAARSPF